MDDFYNDILKIFRKAPDTLFGITNIEFSEYKLHYKCALVIAVPHRKLLGIDDYIEEEFEKIICEARDYNSKLLEEITLLLDKNGVEYYIPPVAQSSEKTLVAPFSFKFAGVNAGLGWIGKNDVLITEKYGPRVRLSTILIDYNLPRGIPVTKSRCPSECNICVKNCPFNVLTGHTWNIDLKRDEIINCKLCNQKRSHYLKTLNRKNSCGLCMVSCPIGLRI